MHLNAPLCALLRILCASQSCDNTSPRLRKEIQDGGECGTEGKAQPEIIINLLGCEAIDCWVTQFFRGLSLMGQRSCQILCLLGKNCRNFIEPASAKARTSMFMLILRRAGLAELTVFFGTPDAGRAVFTSQPVSASSLTPKETVLLLAAVAVVSVPTLGS